MCATGAFNNTLLNLSECIQSTCLPVLLSTQALFSGTQELTDRQIFYITTPNFSVSLKLTCTTLNKKWAIKVKHPSLYPVYIYIRHIFFFKFSL